MGTWHTHPQNIPEPSLTDWNDWRETLEKDQTGSEYAFFIIIGLIEFRVWAGNLLTKEICELIEAPIFDGIYVAGIGDSENENQMASYL
jgi:integrative and conjugative element protein (TIGR02256 family)